MNDCESIQTVLERDAQGELSKQQAGELEAHVFDCPDCQDYGATPQGIDALVRIANASVEPPPDFSPVLAKILEDEQRQSRQMWTYLALTLPFLLLAVVEALLEGSVQELWMPLTAFGLFLWMIAGLVKAQFRRRELCQTSDELVQVVRREVAYRRLMSLCGGLFAILAGLGTALATGSVPGWSEGAGLAERLLPLALSAALLAAGVYVLVVIRPRQGRELDAHG